MPIAIIIIIILILILIFNKCVNTTETYTEINNLNNNNNDLDNKYKLDMQTCSFDCCGMTQWTPKMDPNYNQITSELNNNNDLFNNGNISNKYVPSNFSCNNGNDGGGCLCLDNANYNNLQNHGTNK